MRNLNKPFDLLLVLVDSFLNTWLKPDWPDSTKPDTKPRCPAIFLPENIFPKIWPSPLAWQFKLFSKSKSLSGENQIFLLNYVELNWMLVQTDTHVLNSRADYELNPFCGLCRQILICSTFSHFRPDSPLIINTHFAHFATFQKPFPSYSYLAKYARNSRLQFIVSTYELDLNDGKQFQTKFFVSLQLLIITLPKAQRTRGLSSSYQSNFLRSYHNFKHKSWSNFIFRIST